ncbi:MAG: hypothetical protein ACRCT8_06045 [Lacipirellulaceae bacterium]
MPRINSFLPALVGGVALAASPALAILNSFTPNDGYAVQSGDVRGDVGYYNSGAYGANAGGGSGPTFIPAGSGLWDIVGPAGGYFANAVDRAAFVAQGVPYSASFPNAIGAYAVGGHFGGRTDNFNLALRNDTPIGTGPMVHDYELDQYDFGGIVPATVTAGPVSLGFYFCPNPGDTPDPLGAPSKDKFTMSFKDSGGNVGFQWGYLRDNSVVWRTSSSNPWNATSFVADQTNWDGIKLDIDLTGDTFSLDYFDVSASTWTNLVPTGTALGQNMTDFTYLRWQLEDGLNAGPLLGKNFFDDFSFTAIPEPTSAVLGALALGGFARRRR